LTVLLFCAKTSIHAAATPFVSITSVRYKGRAYPTDLSLIHEFGVPTDTFAMNPYETPKHCSRMRSGGMHGALAAILMVIALVLRFGVPIMASSDNFNEASSSLWLLSLGGGILWVWGCCHLAMHFGLSGAWGLAGLLFLLGPALIFWASSQKPKWDREAARRPQRQKQYRGDPTSPY
jgi:hypothetical protein